MTEELNKAYYAIIPANVRYDPDIPPNAKLLYGEITALCNQKGYCWATNDYFAKLYNCTKQSVSGWIGKLKEKGYIAVEIIYKEGSKEILNRYIKISDYPIQNNLNTPIQNSFKDNNTSFNNTSNNTFEEIIDYLNEKAGTKFKVKSKSTRQHINARLKEGFVVDDFKCVIDKKCAEWQGTEWEQYLRPSTLFGTKFESYLNAKNKQQKKFGDNGIAISNEKNDLDDVF